MNELVRLLWSFAARSRFSFKCMALLEQLNEQRPNLLRVLTYHSVDEPEAFDQQMKYLAANYHVVSMRELLEAYQHGDVLPPRSVMVTFDDAYSNFAEHAWPILKRYQLPVTLFVPTAFPGHPERVFWWDRLQQAINSTARRDELDTPVGRLSLATAAQRDQAFRRLRSYVKSLYHGEALALVEKICDELEAPPPEHHVLGWDELRRLAHEGVTMGAHSRTHPLMNRISTEEARSEAAGSLHDLEREIGPVPPVFAYPSGGVNDEVVKVLAHEGFALAFTIVRGTNDLRKANQLRLRRNNVGQRATVDVLRARLLQSSVHLNRWRPLSGS
ncbi:MAG: polysaccharide deacetylase family protein [Anaerolineae bacterium]